MKIGEKEINKDDVILAKPQKIGGYMQSSEFQAKVINVYSHALVVQDAKGNYFDLSWDEVEKLEE